jgi:hypothetical protein
MTCSKLLEELLSLELDSAALDSGVSELLEYCGGSPLEGGSTAVELLSQLTQKKLVNASDNFFQCL